MLLSSRYFPFNFFDIIDSAPKALANQNVQFDFSHIEPATMFWGVHQFETIPQGFRFFRVECFVQRAWSVGIQIVHNQVRIKPYVCDRARSYILADVNPVPEGWPTTG